MHRHLTTVAFGADDTLWDNEWSLRMTQAHFAGLLSSCTDPTGLMQRSLSLHAGAWGTTDPASRALPSR
ncbi:hypothetical protein [Roseobacter weihaiensis]|uniref:hypothetical protein n=1 Tax=Roseobacter weihaiensis TaxID=2763262 RepID=UPI001D0B023E|nr:hypothetical protein [Roseobacter sp. H9]